MTTEKIKQHILKTVFYEYITTKGHMVSRWVFPKNIYLVLPLVGDLPIELDIKNKRFRLKRQIS